MRRINIVIDPALDDRLELAAAARGTSKSALVRECVDRGLPPTTEDNGLLGLLVLASEFAEVESADDIDEVIYGPSAPHA